MLIIVRQPCLFASQKQGGIAALATAATSIFTLYAELSSLTVPDVDDTLLDTIGISTLELLLTGFILLAA